MPIDSSTSTPYLPSYADAMRAQPRSADSLPPPAYEFAPSYTKNASEQPANRQASSRPTTNLAANRISSQPSAQAMRGMNTLSGLSR
jgi:hypothetical protein